MVPHIVAELLVEAAGHGGVHEPPVEGAFTYSAA